MEKQVNSILSDKEKKEIGKRFLKAFKDALSLENIEKIGELVGYGDKAVYKIAGGQQELNFSKLVNFRNLTGHSIDWLLTGEWPKLIKRIDFKNLWTRIVKAWETELAASKDNSIKADLDAAKEMSQRNFLPSFDVVQRVSNITHTPLLWLLTGEGASRADRPYENPPVFLADLIVDYKAKEALPLPLKNKLMSTDIHGVEFFKVPHHGSGNRVSFSAPEEEAIKKLSSQTNLTREEIIRQVMSAHLMIHGLVSFQEIIRSSIMDSLEGQDLDVVPEYDDRIPQADSIESSLNTNDFNMPEGVGILFKDWDKIPDDDKLATLQQIEGIVKKKISKPDRRKKK
jgi:hypothetical protein